MNTYLLPQVLPEVKTFEKKLHFFLIKDEMKVTAG